MDQSSKPDRLVNPKERANFFSQAIFAYTLPTFIKGFKKDLTEEDIPKCLNVHSSKQLGNKLETEWIKQKNQLLKALIRAFGLEFALIGLVCFFNQMVLNIGQPLALAQVMTYYTQTNSNISCEQAKIYAAVIVVISFLKVLVEHYYCLALRQFGMKLRVACGSLVYRKSLRLSKTALGKTRGKIMTLLSTDMRVFDQAALNAHMIWISMCQIFALIFILFFMVNMTSVIGLLFMTLFIPFQVLLGSKLSAFHRKTSHSTDERLGLMGEIISGIEVIKMYAWELPFSKLVVILRRLEIHNLRAKLYLKAIMTACVGSITRFSLFLTILVHILFGNTLDAEYVFVVISFYNIMRQGVMRQLSLGIIQLSDAQIILSRIQELLLLEEPSSDPDQTPPRMNGNSEAENLINLKPVYEHNTILGGTNAEVELQNVSAYWSPESACVLNKVDFYAQQGHLVSIVGLVGSGKTSLLQAILKELPLSNGILTVKGIISYASQEPWVFAGSVQQNILFGEPMNLERYQQVIRACALERDLALLPFKDKTLVGERGVKLSGGQRARINLARAVYREADIYLLDDPLAAVDAPVGKQIFENCICEFLKHKCTIFTTNQFQYLRHVDFIYLIHKGQICKKGAFRDIVKCKLESPKKLLESNDASLDNDSLEDSITQHEEPIEEKEQRSFRQVAGAIYCAYFKAGGSLLVTLTILLLFVLKQFSISGSDYFLTFWVNMQQEKVRQVNTTIHERNFVDLLTTTCFSIYFSIVVAMIVLTLAATFAFNNYTMKVSIKLHDNMLSNLISTPMHFFKTNNRGRIMNRFSNDMRSIDEYLPAELLSFVEMCIYVLGATCLISFIKPWVLLVTATMFIIFYSLRIVYLRTSRSIRRLDGITLSPMLGHLNESLQGVITIRAYGAQNMVENEFDDLQDVHTSVSYLFLVCSRTFGFWLDMLCVCYIALVTFSFFVEKSEKYGGNVGLAITQALSLTGRFQIGMRHWSELENQMTSVERVLEYTNLKCEPERTKSLPSKWPEEGLIEFTSVSLRYSTADPYILNKVSFQIKPKEKIGIVGRTGAGKSSLLHALFQLSEIEGTITIDNVDITKIPLRCLRSKITIIPQNPVLFSGSLRENLDPFGEYSDGDLWYALKQVDLRNEIANFAAGLQIKMGEGGSNFSVGQKQLICLARAIVRKNKILVLDEATANVDPKTDSFIQSTIRKKFADCTVLTVAHRLQTIMDSDKVLVMDAGSVAEFDHPYLLLNNPISLFHSMVQHMGDEMATRLTNVAKQSFEEKLTARYNNSYYE